MISPKSTQWSCGRLGETAKAIKRSPRSMERDRAEGEGPPFVKIGGRVFYRRCDVVNWLESRVFSSTAEYQAARAAVVAIMVVGWIFWAVTPVA